MICKVCFMESFSGEHSWIHFHARANHDNKTENVQHHCNHTYFILMQSQLIAATHLTTIRQNAEGKFKEASDCFCNVRLRPGRLLIGDRWDLYSVVRFAADELWVIATICVTQSRWPSMPNRKQLLPSRRLIDLFKSQHGEKTKWLLHSLWGSILKYNAPQSNVNIERKDSECPKKGC